MSNGNNNVAGMNGSNVMGGNTNNFNGWDLDELLDMPSFLEKYNLRDEGG